ncbi:MAG: beta-ketoacyl-ACP synthase III [Planctomycetota bacterium]
MAPRNTAIAAMGSYVPEDTITNDDLEQMVDTSDEWITGRTGIKERRKGKPDQCTSDLAYEAAREALDRAGVSPDQLDAVIVATISPDMNFPSTACFLQKKLRCHNAACWDVSAACSGFLYALRSGRALIGSGDCDNVLIVGSEFMTKITNYEDRTSCILFGDAAGAAVLQPSHGRRRVLDIFTISDGYSDAAMSMVLRCGGTQSPFCPEALERKEHLQVIHGREVYRFAVTKLTEVIQQAAEKQGVPVSEIDAIIPHQANLRILQAVAERLDYPEERFFINLDKYGNSSAASVPVALDEADKQGFISEGDLVVLAVFGAGLTWASATLRW